MGRVAEAEQDAGGTLRSAKRRRSRASGAIADAAADQDRPGGARAPAPRGSEKALPSGPLTQTPSPASSSQSRSVPGPIPSIRKSSRTPPAAGPVSATESARGRKGRPPRSSQWRSVASM